VCRLSEKAGVKRSNDYFLDVIWVGDLNVESIFRGQSRRLTKDLRSAFVSEPECGSNTYLKLIQHPTT
jgi:hypothetical protein